MSRSDLTVRAATQDDDRTLQLLAWLSRGSRPVPGRTLLAERAGVPLAAIALTSGAVLADPFNATPDTVRLLRYWRYRIVRQGGQTGVARSVLRRRTAKGRASSCQLAAA